MNNRDRAAEVLLQDRCWIPGPGGMERFSVAEGADALAAAGLLAPDLPKPDKDSPFPGTSWEVYKQHGGAYVVSSRLGQVQAPGFGGGHSPAKTRAIAYALLAAADRAEKEAQ